MNENHSKKYILAFVITVTLFVGTLYVSNTIDNKRIADIKSVEDRISIDILSSETQFTLLKETSCNKVNESILSKELNDLATKLSYMESTLGADDPQVLQVKKFYSLLEIKDYILMQSLTKQCGLKPISLLYFYSNKGDCPECDKMGYVLTYLREQYPGLRIYSFDYNLDLSAIHTLIDINQVANKFPVLVMNDDVYYGFKDLDLMKKILPLDKLVQATTTSATSTKK